MTISISGTVYIDEGVTPIGSGRTLDCSVNGAASSGSTTTASDGTYTIAGITAAAAAVVTIYIQDGVNTEKAVTVTRSTGSNMTGIDLYQDHLNVRSDDGTAFSGANMNTSDNNGDTGISAIYSASSATVLTLASGKSLLIMSGQTYTPGSTTITVPGNFVNNGTYTKTLSDVLVMTGSGSQTVKTNGSTMIGLTLNTGSGTVTLQDNWSGTGSVVLAGSMTLDVSSSNFSIQCTSWMCTGGTFVARGGTVTLIATAATIKQVNTGAFYNLVIAGANPGTCTLSTTALTVSNNLTINATKGLDVSASNFAVTVGGNWINNGSFTAQSGTVTFNGTAQTISGTTTFNNFVASTSGDVISFTDGTTTTVSNAVTFQRVILQGTSTGGWTIAMPATQTIDHTTVSHSTATGNTAVADSTCVNGGNNTNWTFAAAASVSNRSAKIGAGCLKTRGNLINSH